MKLERIMISAGVATFFCLAGVRADMGIASIGGTSPDSKVNGIGVFVDTKDGLKVTINVKGAPPGSHGLHIHEFGSCEDVGRAAGGHYNPLNSPHGMIMKDGPKKAHKGDLGNIDIGPDGSGKLEALIPNLTLSNGKFTVGGRAVILHEKADDFGQPVGNAGGRIGCGTIILTGK